MLRYGVLDQVVRAVNAYEDFMRPSVPPPLAGQRDRLNRLVERSYGAPHRLQLTRTGCDPIVKALREARSEDALAVVGQVVELDLKNKPDHVLLNLQGTGDEEQEAWTPLPFELPGWALDGTSFEAMMSRRIELFRDLEADRYALRSFVHAPRAYESIEEIAQHLVTRKHGL
jgi:hypothetical protein